MARDKEAVAAANKTCVACHTPYRPGATGEPTQAQATIHDTDTMHTTNIGVSCIDCHGGKAEVKGLPDNPDRSDKRYDAWKLAAHVKPTHPELWKPNSAANPESSRRADGHESADYVRFVNPGDLRAAAVACGVVPPRARSTASHAA